MKKMSHYSQARFRQRGFSLVEVLVAMSILAILVIVMTQLLATSAGAINGSGKNMTADGEARQLFNRMEVDFSGILKRNDLDIVFYKPELGGSLNNSPSGNDTMYFFSQAPAYFSTTDTTLSSPISLIGYRVDNNVNQPPDKDFQQMERLGQGLTWDVNGGASSTTPLVFLTWYPSMSNGTNNSTPGLASASLISSAGAGGYPPYPYYNAVGPAPYDSVASTLNPTVPGPPTYGASYELLGPDVFRFEFCFALSDGSYSDCPVLSVTPSAWKSANPNCTFFHEAAASPTPSSAETVNPITGAVMGGYTVGSRWYNTSTGEAFICVSGNPNNAVWAGAGVQDISAIIVTVAILDNTSRQLVANNLTSGLGTIAGDLADSNLDASLGSPRAVQSIVPTLPASNWNSYIDANAQTMAQVTGFPKQVITKIRVYQRAFYLKTESVDH